MAKGVSHKGKSDVAHAETALCAGRPYEKSNEGHNQMFSDMKELEQHNSKEFGHNTSKQSRGERIDHELEEEDRKIVEKMNEARQKREEVKHRKED
jgi:hypothetical protein